MSLQSQKTIFSDIYKTDIISFTLPKRNSKIHKKVTLMLIPQAFMFVEQGKDKFIGKNIHTSMMQIENITDAKLGYAYATDICSLVSFISHHHILCDNNQYGVCENSFYKIPIQFSQNPLNDYSFSKIQDFFKHAWKRYRHYKTGYKLDKVIHYLTLSYHKDYPLELQIPSLMIALEILGAGFKESHQKPLHSSLRDALFEIAKEYKISDDYLEQIVSLRNNIFHGNIQDDRKKQQDILYVGRDFIRTYILKLIRCSNETK